LNPTFEADASTFSSPASQSRIPQWPNGSDFHPGRDNPTETRETFHNELSLEEVVRKILRRLFKVARNSRSLLMGYNIYVDADKLGLIDRAFQIAQPAAISFADLGGVWKVNGAYTRYALRRASVRRGVLVDTDFPPRLHARLSSNSRLQLIDGDFSSPEITSEVGNVDIVFFFDVLLHQAKPSWDVVLTTYAKRTPCVVIYNQQYVLDTASVRLTALPLNEYLALAPREGEDLYRHVYAHGDEKHPKYGKPWRDIHNIFQWGITDRDLRATMTNAGFQEVFYRNYGRFSTLTAFENHGFVFVKEGGAGSRHP
jgi:hypothetical protein